MVNVHLIGSNHLNQTMLRQTGLVCCKNSMVEDNHVLDSEYSSRKMKIDLILDHRQMESLMPLWIPNSLSQMN